MKRILSLLCMLTMTFSLTACGSQGGAPSSSTPPASSTPPSSSTAAPESSQPTPGGESSATEESSMPESTGTETESSKALVVYFSATGTTEKLAGYIAEVTAGDLYEIVPAEPYTTEDLNYSDNNSRSTKEQNDVSARPAISGSVEDMAQYDTIFLGYPMRCM